LLSGLAKYISVILGGMLLELVGNRVKPAIARLRQTKAKNKSKIIKKTLDELTINMII